MVKRSLHWVHYWKVVEVAREVSARAWKALVSIEKHSRLLLAYGTLPEGTGL